MSHRLARVGVILLPTFIIAAALALIVVATIAGAFAPRGTERAVTACIAARSGAPGVTAECWSARR